MGVARKSRRFSPPSHTHAGLFETVTIELFDRFVPHADPDLLEKLLIAARDWIVRNLRHRESNV